MRLILRAAMLAACLCMNGSCHAEPGGPSQAWFYSTLQASTTPVTWCSFVTEASAEAAASSERFESHESGWLRHRGNSIESIKIMLQSEDAYMEDTYTFGPDLTVTQVIREGHYITDPFVSATFKPDDRGRLRMTDESHQALRSWTRATYFFEWPLYASFSEIPFAGLIETTPDIAVSESCQEIHPERG